MFPYSKTKRHVLMTILVFGSLIILSCQENNKSNEITYKSNKDITRSIPSFRPVNEELYDTILKLDSKFWKAWNEGDLNVIEEFTSENHEFYHDRGGVVKSKEENMKLWKSFFKNRPPERGTGFSKFNEVYEIPDFGALHVGYQQFFNEKNPDGTPPSRVITLWKKTNDGWKQEYVFSTHPHPADKFDSIQVFNIQNQSRITMKKDFEYDFINDYMQTNSIDTTINKPEYQLLVHYPGQVIDTIISTGKIFKYQNAPVWMKSTENLISKYQQD